MPDYEHTVFVSYRRLDERWIRWTSENFAGALRSILSPSLGDISIFVDGHLEIGATWPLALAQKLARSKVLVPVLSRAYFQSGWCLSELDLMLQREKVCGLTPPGRRFGLIFPAIIDDGDHFPTEIRAIQSESLHDLANPYMHPNSRKQQYLAERLMKRLCPSICSAVLDEAFPNYDPKWEGAACRVLAKVFRSGAQPTVPRLSLRSVK